MPKKNSSAPKRALSAFMFFSNHRRPDINKQQPNLKIGDVAKIIGAEWKKLSEEEKKPFNKMAEKDKLRYADEMKNYVPSPEELAQKGKGGQGSKRQRRDPNEPKKAGSAYTFFMKHQSAQLKQSKPDMPFQEMSKKIADMWKQISASEKAKFEKMASDDKLRYQREMTAYRG